MEVMMRVGQWEGLSGHAPLLGIYLLVMMNQVMRNRMIRYYPPSELASPFFLPFMFCFSLYLPPPPPPHTHLQLQRDKTKGVEGLIEVANPNRVVKKTKKAGDIDINARVELSRRERLVTSQSHSQSHATASFQFQLHNAVSFPVTPQSHSQSIT